MNEAAPRYSLQVLSLLSRTFLRLARSLVDRFPTLAVAYRYVRDNRLGGYNPRDTPMGFRFAGNAGMESGTFEPVETALMGSVLRDSDVFVNVGANIGYYCCLALRTGAYVVAFEPMPGNLYWLYRNISANGWQQRAEIFPMALANRIGLVDIFGGATGASLIRGWAGTPEQYVTTVPVSTMDTVLGGRFKDRRCVIVVDVEGAEKLVLEGAESFLSRIPKPIWMVEVSVSDHQPAGTVVNPHLMATFSLFWDREYEAWAIDRELRRVRRDDVRAVLDTGVDTLRARNFLFAAKDTL
jgi:FkbM family methyltransferase